MNLALAVCLVVCFLISSRSAEEVNFYNLVKVGKIKESVSFMKNSPESFLLNLTRLKDTSDSDLVRLADEVFSEIQSALIFENERDEFNIGVLMNNLNVLMSARPVRDNYRLTYEFLSSLVNLGNEELLNSFVRAGGLILILSAS